MKQITFITLHYNRSNVIEETIFSIVPNNNIEHLIIDDGSNSIEFNNLINLVRRYNKINHIKLVRLNHTGNLSYLKNFAIKFAKGKYITFVDSDDYINNIAMNKILKQIHNSYYDIISLPRIFIRKNKNIINKKFNILNPLKKECYICLAHYVIRKKLLIKHNIRYEEKKFNYYADDLFVFLQLCLLLHTIKIKYMNIDCYYISKKIEDSSVKLFEKKINNLSALSYLFNYEKFIKEYFKKNVDCIKYGELFINDLILFFIKRNVKNDI